VNRALEFAIEIGFQDRHQTSWGTFPIEIALCLTTIIIKTTELCAFTVFLNA
jgi:hypothetical protein